MKAKKLKKARRRSFYKTVRALYAVMHVQRLHEIADEGEQLERAEWYDALARHLHAELDRAVPGVFTPIAPPPVWRPGAPLPDKVEMLGASVVAAARKRGDS